MTDFMNMDMNMKAISCFLIGLKFLSLREWWWKLPLYDRISFSLLMSKTDQRLVFPYMFETNS